MQSRRSFNGRSGAALGLLALAATACVERPENGDVITGNTLAKALSFFGRHPDANKQIRIQVLKAPDDPAQNNPNIAANWVTIATATSSNTPLNWNGTDPYHEWSVTGTPAPNVANAARWPQGGIMRFRAIDADDRLLLAFDQDRLDCYLANAGESWQNIGTICQSTFSAAAVVSPSPTPDEVDTPRYLSFGGAGSEAETAAYYEAINAPTTFANFKARYGFDSGLTDEASATYFNASDLGTGRQMHCKSQLQLNAPPLRICYVANYADGAGVKFGADPPGAVARAVTDAKANTQANAFATVAMVFSPPITNHNSVRFMVYSQNGQLETKAALDNEEFNTAIPQNCLTCHGGGTYDAANHRVPGASASENGARFLAFDLDAFEYSTEAGFTRADQQESFRKLNRHISLASPSAQTAALIAGWYAAGSVNTAGTTADTSFVPPGYSAQPADAKFYRDVFAPYCRGCHVAQTTPFLFETAEDFKDFGALIDLRVCNSGLGAGQKHLMPNAEVTLKRFWASPARAYLAGYLGSRGSCKP
jgi:hypothetical protein